MKEMGDRVLASKLADRILDSKVVDIAEENGSFILKVLKLKGEYDIVLSSKEPAFFTPKTMKEAGNLLIELAEELESRKKFKDGDYLFFVSPEGGVLYFSFDEEYATHLGMVMSGNAFKTREEAETHKEEIMAKYQGLKDKGLV